MNSRYILLAAMLLLATVIAIGCTTPNNTMPSNITPTLTPSRTVIPYTPPGKITTLPDLVAFVVDGAAYARENGREKAIAAFSDRNGSFVSGNTHIFAIDYNGTLLADALEPEIVGTNIQDMIDSFSTPLVQHLAETARFGIGYVSYTYPNPGSLTIDPQIAVSEDIDGTYYIAAGYHASDGEVYLSAQPNTSGIQPDIDQLQNYVKSFVAYAQSIGTEKALTSLNDPKSTFAQGNFVLLAFDYNGTNLAGTANTPDQPMFHLNLLNYQDPDGVEIFRGMRDIARNGGGFYYTLEKVKENGKKVYVPAIDYIEPVDGDCWVYSGMILPEYAGVSAGDWSGIQIRNHTRQDLYDLVNQAVAYAKANGKNKTLAEINNPNGQFVIGDFFVWAETLDGTVLADPYWKSGIGQNYINYTDSYGVMTTRVGLDAMTNGSGFYHSMFPNTAMNGTADVPKLLYMQSVDKTWWIGSGIYGVEAR